MSLKDQAPSSIHIVHKSSQKPTKQFSTFDDPNLKPENYPIILYELNENAATSIFAENYEKALSSLLHAQYILDQLCIGNYTKNLPIALLTFHNLALCSQKLGMLKECGDFLKQCLELMKHFATKDTPEDRLKHLKYLSKVHMQYCAVLSQQNMHVEALDHAKYGVKYTHKSLQEAIKIAEGLAGKSYNFEARSIPGNTKKSANDSLFLGESLTQGAPEMIIAAVAGRILPILYELRSRTIPEGRSEGHVKTSSVSVKPTQPTAWSWRKHRFQLQSQPHQQPPSKSLDIRNLLGYCQTSEWGSSLNIGSIMQITPMTLQDFLYTYNKELEISRESLLEKVALISVAYFCISTEKRFLAQNTGGKDSLNGRQSEFWHGKSLELVCCFLPPECPLVNHIFVSYQKHHSVLHHAIPEDMGVTDNIKLIKPLNGSTGLGFQPIVRASDEAFTLSPINAPEFYISFSSPATRSSTTSKQRPNKNQILEMIYANPKTTVKPRLNESFMENSKRLSQGKHTPDASLLLSHISIDESGGPKRPKSSQSFSVKPISSKVKPRPSSKLKQEYKNEKPSHNMSNIVVPNLITNDLLGNKQKVGIRRATQPAKRPIKITNRLPKELELVKQVVGIKRMTEGFAVSKGGIE